MWIAPGGYVGVCGQNAGFNHLGLLQDGQAALKPHWRQYNKGFVELEDQICNFKHTKYIQNKK